MNQYTSPPSSAQPAKENAGRNLDFSTILALLWHRRWWLIASTLLMTTIGIYLVGSQPRIYLADSLIQIEDKGTSASLLGPLAGQAVGKDEGSTSDELEILASRLVLGQAVARERLNIVVTPVRYPLIGNWLSNLDFRLPDSLGGNDYAWGDDALTVTTLNLSGQWQRQALTLEVVDAEHYRLLDAEGTLLMRGTVGENALMEGIKVFVQRLSAKPGARFKLASIPDLSAINAIKSRFTSVRNGTDTGVVTLSLSGSDQAAIVSTLDAITDVFLQQNIERESAEADSQLNFLGDQIPTLRGQLDEAESALNDYRRRRDSVDLTAESQQVMENLVGLDNQLTEIKLRLAELSRAYTPQHPAYRALVARRGSLNEEKARVQKQAEQLPAAQREALNLNRNVTVSQEIYVALLNKREEVRLKKAGTVGNVRILDPAVLQPGLISPKTSLMMMVFSMAGLMLGVLVVLMRYSMRKGIDSAEQIEALDLPVYATIPLSPLQPGMMRRVRLKGEKGGREIYQGILATSQPSDISIEALRSLRTSLHFALLDNHRKSVMFTGPSPGIGKSFVSLNLAAVSAEAGQRVLLIDADMRRGHLHHAFQRTSEQGGLSDVLSGVSSLEDVLYHSRIDNLDFLGRGVSPPNPSELLMQPNFAQLLDLLGERYDLIIIDTPPVLAVTEALIIGRHVGASLMVARYGMNQLRELEHARKKLENNGIHVKGAILNAIEQGIGDKSSYGYYNYSYA